MVVAYINFGMVFVLIVVGMVVAHTKTDIVLVSFLISIL
jgi:hypothetical protein